MRVVFVNYGRENLGIEYLSAFLKREGISVSLVNDPGLFSREDNVLYVPVLEKLCKIRNIAEQVIKLRPDVVAFSVYTSTYGWAREVAAQIKERCGVATVAGGIHSTLVPEQVIADPCFDYVLIGEAENSFLHLLRAISDSASLSTVPNLYYRENGRIKNTDLCPAIQDLDTLPFPDKELFFDYVRYQDDYAIMTSRGCHFSCSYCCESYVNSLYRGTFFRRRSVSSVISELESRKGAFDFREVMFFDSIFFTDRKWLKDFIEQYKKKINVPFRCVGHVNYFDEEVGRLLKDGGCYGIDFGIQTFNEQIRSGVLGRKESNGQALKVFSSCDCLGLRYDVDIMFELPGIQEQDYKDVIGYVDKMRLLNRIKCFNLSYYPRLPILNAALGQGILDEADLKDIENGDFADYYHRDSLKDRRMKRVKASFQKLFKVYPALPRPVSRFVVSSGLYRSFWLVPAVFVIALQFFAGMRNKDIRFSIYCKNYIFQIKRRLGLTS